MLMLSSSCRQSEDGFDDVRASPIHLTSRYHTHRDHNHRHHRQPHHYHDHDRELNTRGGSGSIRFSESEIRSMPNLYSGHFEESGFDASRRISFVAPAYPSYRMESDARDSSSRERSQEPSETTLRHRRKHPMVRKLKRTARQAIKMIPEIEDFSKIDRYSRIIFPVSFLVFNVLYWLFYIF